MALWATIEQVEAELGVTADQRMTDALDAANAWCQRQRPDLDPEVDPGYAVARAVVLEAKRQYQLRASPAYGQYPEVMVDDVSNGRSDIFMYLGKPIPVAR